MPNTGDSFNTNSDLEGRFDFYAWLGATAGNGVWFSIRGVKSASIHAKTLPAANTLVVQVSNAPAKPDDSVDGVIDQTITGTGSEQLVTLSKLPALWCKLDKTGTDDATAYFHGLAR